MFDVNKKVCLLKIIFGKSMKAIESIQCEKPVQSTVQCGCRSQKKFHIYSSSACVYEFVLISMCVSVCLCVQVSVPVFPYLCACTSFSASRGESAAGGRGGP